MASIFPARSVDREQIDYSRRMSSHLAAALVLFAVAQIGVVGKLGGSLVMHFGIFLAIGGFAMAARALEARWASLSTSALPRERLDALFRADLIPLWAASLGAPFLWVPVSIIFRALFR